MMRTAGLKYIFYISSAFLLFLMLFQSRNTGITCDEVLHYDHSVCVYNYFATNGKDRSALDTPDSHLKYYGQSFDNIVTILTRWLKIEDVYGFRHIMSALAGWLTLFLTALFAVWLTGYRSAIIVLFLFAVSPTFMGHAHNNLKDIPFALSYIAGIFFSLRYLFREAGSYPTDIFLLILSIGFSISIRAGGLILICYLFFFCFLFLLYKQAKDAKIDINEAGKRLVIIVLISFSAIYLSILLWPFALQNPFKNILASYKVMAHFPATFRQIFEGTTEWSDFMPWYYLPKSMVITIPLLISAGLLIFFIFSKRIYESGKSVVYGMILFTLFFPVFFAIIDKSNLYSSWRQFLFLYPVIVLISATGFNLLFDSVKNRYIRWLYFALFSLLSIHPVRYMVNNPSYYYLYYNQLTGGLNGAHGNYETDYYYTGQTEASGWLLKYLDEKKIDTALIGATFPVKWQFRNHHGYKTFYFRNEERSQYDWDYAIITNRYIPVFKLKDKSWPPENAIHIIYADSVPICAVLERRTRADFFGYKALGEGRTDAAIGFFIEALRMDNQDEMIFYNFARALYKGGESVKADSVLKKGLELNPDFEPILMYLGNIARAGNDTTTAKYYYNKVLNVNRKYFDAYIGLAEMYEKREILEARRILRTCLIMNPKYKPAISVLADTYRETDPAIAEKYDKLLKTIK